MSDPLARLNDALAGRYVLERELGQGGMATVYVAMDLRHHRRVAVKVLKPQLAAMLGAERFLAEIETTANLQHPHILPLFDSGEADSLLFYVMPYVEGVTLRNRLDREHQLPVDEAVRIATDVAEALDYAHRRGVVHRDISPANILLQDGKAVVSDFGIAVAVGGADRGRLTETGLSLGTPRYMSPEQATGDSNVGPASDIWSLGCVLYEMLAGEPPYGGSTPQAIVGQIVTGRADAVTRRRRSTPANVGAAVAKALEKVPSDRFTRAKEFARALADPAFRHGEQAGRRRWTLIAAAAALAYVLGLVTWSTLNLGGSVSDARTPVRFLIPDLGGLTQARSLALSGDGTYLAHAGGGALTVRRVDDTEHADTLARSNVAAPFFSPDAESVAYFLGVSTDLLRVSRSGGLATLVAPGSGARARGGTWGDDGTIVWATTSGLYRVPSEGGEVVLVATPNAARGEIEYSWPVMLPGSRRVLFTIVPAGAQSDRDASIGALDLEGGEVTVVLAGGSAPRYSATGHLLFSAGGTLHAVALDAATGRVRAERVPLPIEGVAITAGWGADYDASANGTLAYRPSLQGPATLAWRDREGREEPLSMPALGYGYRRLSPDGRRLVYDRWLPGGGPTRDVYVWDFERSSEIRLTDDPGEEFFADWSADGEAIYYSGQSRVGAFLEVKRRAANGTGDEELIFASDANLYLNDVSPDGRTILVARPDGGAFDLLRLSLLEPVRAEPLVSGPASEYNGFISPDGSLYAYQTDRDGRFEIWAGRLAASNDAPVKVSVAGGVEATWSARGDEIFYRSPEGFMMAAAIVTAPRLGVREVVRLFPIDDGVDFGRTGGRAWDVSPLDGRFLMARRQRSEGGGIRVVLNWDVELRRSMAER